MARVPVVTRTIKSTKCIIMGVDIQTGEVENKAIILPRTYADDAKMLRKAKEKAETETFKVVQVVSYEVLEQKYGMPEEKFVELATPIVD